MAHTLTLIDDLDGTSAADTIAFAVDGERYKIDLSSDNIAKFMAALAPYIDAAKVVGKKKNSSGTDLDKVRTWARENGHNVSDKGRISQEVMEAYQAAKKEGVAA